MKLLSTGKESQALQIAPKTNAIISELVMSASLCVSIFHQINTVLLFKSRRNSGQRNIVSHERISLAGRSLARSVYLPTGSISVAQFDCERKGFINV